MAPEHTHRENGHRVLADRDSPAFQFVRRAALACVLLLAVAWPAVAQDAKPLRGVALIIGNGAYEHLTPLANPEADAEAIEDLFDDLGFETFDARDADARKLRRAIERFVEDAEGADVAVLYYAGHGIEAGGENYLVPTDADISALDDAGAKLVPLTRLLADLRAAVPMTIILLDACRDNPFPPGAMVRAEPDAAPAPLSAGGLGETRGVTRFGDKPRAAGAPDPDSLGALIGFAAEPGRRALDGEPGGNSPYAAAVLRHIAAMTGEEFGTVMRMVAEEVYLKTGGQQRPWVNESLRRLLYFGRAEERVEGAEGDILRERRQLLVTIAALPDAERRTIETVARDGGLPMDAVYGMLRALGADAPKDPAQLEALLRQQSEKIRQMQAERETIKSTDPEIARLAALADEAISEGALQTAVKLNGEAKARVTEIEATVADAEADIKARRLEFAEVYARSGKTAYMTFDYAQSAADYEQAFRQVERWDDWLAWSHRGNQAVALQAIGWRGGQTDRLREAAVLAREIVALSERLPGRDEWALSQMFLGNTLSTLGQREKNADLIREAAAAYEAALGAMQDSSKSFDIDRLEVMYNLAGARQQIAYRERDERAIEAAAEGFAELAKLHAGDGDARRRARALSAQAATVTDLARTRKDSRGMRRASELASEAMAIRRGQAEPGEWRDYLIVGAIADSETGIMEDDLDLLLRADRLFAEAMPLLDRAQSAVNWAQVHHNRATNSHNIYLLDRQPVWLERAIADYRSALDARDRTAQPVEWADSMAGVGGTTVDLGRHRSDVPLVRQGRQAFLDARAALDPASERDEWLRLGWLAADALRTEGDVARDLAPLDAALGELETVLADARRLAAANVERLLGRVAAVAHSFATLAGGDGSAEPALAGVERAIGILSGSSAPGHLAGARSALGRALYSISVARKDAATMRRAAEAYRSALVPEAKAEPHDIWANVQGNLGLALRELSRMENDRSLLPEAAAAYREAEGEKDPDVWLKNRRNLAWTLDEIGGAASLAEAALAWEEILGRLKPDAPASERAGIIENRARSLHNLAAAEADPEAGARARRDAIAGYREAARLFPATDTDAASRIGENLADLVKVEAEIARDTARLTEAADLYGAILSRPARVGDDAIHRRLRLKQAQTLVSVSYATADPAAMARAVALFGAAYGAGIPADLDDWSSAATYANALRAVAFENKDVAKYRLSADILSALAARDIPGITPADRAWLVASRADTFLYLADATREASAAREAVASYRKAIAHYTAEAYPAAWRGPHASFASALMLLGSLVDDGAAFAESAEIYGALASAASRDTEPVQWAEYVNGSAYALGRAARLGDVEPARLAAAADLARDALAINAREMPATVPHVSDTLCTVMIEQGRLQRTRAVVEDGLKLCARAIEAFKGVDAHMAGEVEKTVARGREVLSAL
jgi:uncharacterized caspase-like protein